MYKKKVTDCVCVRAATLNRNKIDKLNAYTMKRKYQILQNSRWEFGRDEADYECVINCKACHSDSFRFQYSSLESWHLKF